MVKDYRYSLVCFGGLNNTKYSREKTHWYMQSPRRKNEGCEVDGIRMKFLACFSRLFFAPGRVDGIRTRFLARFSGLLFAPGFSRWVMRIQDI